MLERPRSARSILGPFHARKHGRNTLAIPEHPWCRVPNLLEISVPTLFRFLFVIAILAGLVYAAMFALATLVEPEPREMTITLPNSRLSGR